MATVACRAGGLEVFVVEIAKVVAETESQAGDVKGSALRDLVEVKIDEAGRNATAFASLKHCLSIA